MSASASYRDPETGSLVERQVNDHDEIVEVVRKVIAKASERGHPALELTRADGSSLMVGIEGDRAVLRWIDSLGASCHSLGQVERAGVMLFDYFGEWTEVPWRYVVTIDEAISALVSYSTSGYPDEIDFVWEPD